MRTAYSSSPYANAKTADQTDELLEVFEILISIGKSLRNGSPFDLSDLEKNKTSPAAVTAGEASVHENPVTAIEESP